MIVQRNPSLTRICITYIAGVGAIIAGIATWHLVSQFNYMVVTRTFAVQNYCVLQIGNCLGSTYYPYGKCSKRKYKQSNILESVD